jgi:exopolysaccharide biosynthesis polyprenyl glycosylphosphotransferase
MFKTLHTISTGKPMIQQQVVILNNFLLVVDAVCVVAAGYAAYYLSYFISGGVVPIETNAFYAMLLSMMFINSYMMGRFGLYSDARPKSYLIMVWAIAKAIVLDFTFLGAGLYFYEQLDYSRDFVGYYAAMSFGLILLVRAGSMLYLDHWSPKGFNVSRILIVGDRDRGGWVENILKDQISWGHEIVGRVGVKDEGAKESDVLGLLDELPHILKKHSIDEVVFAVASDRSVDLNPHLSYCHRIGMPVRILPGMWHERECYLSMEVCQGVPFLTMRTTNFNASGLLYKRILDIIGGALGTLCFLFMFPFVATAIKRDSAGPVLFRQKRMGQHGRIFEVIKFRTMCADAEEKKAELLKQNEMNGAIFKLKDDPRITKVGRFLRKTSMDEFPQFINVLKGEMSLVGTRPPTLEEVEKYRPEHLKRIAAKPGITGMWQISGRNKIQDFDRIVELDCQYLDHWRFWEDIKILAKTVFVVLQRKGAI